MSRSADDGPRNALVVGRMGPDGYERSVGEWLQDIRIDTEAAVHAGRDGDWSEHKRLGDRALVNTRKLQVAIERALQSGEAVIAAYVAGEIAPRTGEEGEGEA